MNKMYDVEVKSFFNGDHESHITFPFKSEEEALNYIVNKFEDKDGWELTEDRFDKNLLYYDFMGNPSYEIRIRAV